jgi:hypothetical protein
MDRSHHSLFHASSSLSQSDSPSQVGPSDDTPRYPAHSDVRPTPFLTLSSSMPRLLPSACLRPILHCSHPPTSAGSSFPRGRIEITPKLVALLGSTEAGSLLNRCMSMAGPLLQLPPRGCCEQCQQGIEFSRQTRLHNFQ